MTQSTQTPENSAAEQPQAVSPTGTEQAEVPSEFAIGAFNAPGVDTQQVIRERRGQQNTQAAKPTPAQVEAKGKPEVQQPTAKDERHFSQFISKAAEKAYDMARLAVEANADAIYDIADRDPEMAQRLLKDYQLGANTVDELLQKKNINDAEDPALAELKQEASQRMSALEKELLEERIFRLRGDNPDLNGDLEEKFREVYSDPAFAKFDTAQKLNVARALTGKPQGQQTNANDVAVAILKREEGIVAPAKSASQPDKFKQESASFRAMKSAMGVSDKDLEILPPDIDDLIAQAAGLGR